MSPLGRGGMGAVYRAEDVTLGRPAAIKFLLHTHRDVPENLARFANEARAASALSHPHIVTIYEIGKADDGTPFIAMELVEGRTVRELVQEAPLGLERALDIARQVASALGAAHERGIVHRDIKPENIVLRPDGFVRVLDFGLARLTADAQDGERPTLATSAGMLVGTPSYLSPEQVQGLQADARSDVFALGVVLLEMVTGRNPFDRATLLDTLNAIATEEPSFEGLPSQQVAQVVSRAIDKDPERRFQDGRAFEAELKRALSPAAPEAPREAAAPSSSRAQSGVRTGSLAAVAVLMVAMAAAGWMLVARWRTPTTAGTEQPAVQITQFSTAAREPAFSRDGRLLAYVVDEADGTNSQIYVQPAAGGRSRPITRSPGRKGWPAFSPDGSRVAYTVFTNESDWRWDTWVVPVNGGEPRLFMRNANSLQWLTDGRLLFSEFRVGRQLAVVLAENESRAPARDLYVPPISGMAHFSDLSPDGHSVAIGTMTSYAGEAGEQAVKLDCFIASLDEPDRPTWIGTPSVPCGMYARWDPRGRFLYYSSGSGVEYHLWRRRVPSGEPEQLTHAVGLAVLGVLTSFALSPDGHSVVYASGRAQETAWIREADGRATQVTLEGDARMPALSPDGRTLFYLAAPRFVEGPIWMRSLDGARAESICSGRRAQGFTMSDDGRSVLYWSGDRTGSTQVWECDVSGGTEPRQITSGDGRRKNALFITGGREVVYLERVGGFERIYCAAPDGSARRQVGEAYQSANLQSVSPDGRWLSVLRLDTPETETWLVPLDPSAGSPRKVLVGWSINWAPGGRTIVLRSQGMTSTTWALEMHEERTPNRAQRSSAAPALIPSLPLAPTFEDLTRAGARQLLTSDFFVAGTPTTVPFQYVFSRVTNHSNLWELRLR